jgi:hypothetical protein
VDIFAKVLPHPPLFRRRTEGVGILKLLFSFNSIEHKLSSAGTHESL